jgi:hypothetical protein
MSITCIIKKVDANPLCHHHISIIPTANNPGSIIWLSTTATGPQHCIANKSATESITCIIKEVDVHYQSVEYLAQLLIYVDNAALV